MGVVGIVPLPMDVGEVVALIEALEKQWPRCTMGPTKRWEITDGEVTYVVESAGLIFSGQEQ